MKKILLTAILIVAVLTAAFAGHQVTLLGSPYSLLYADSSTTDPVSSSYGFGGMVEYRMNPFFDNEFFVGAHAGIVGFHFPVKGYEYTTGDFSSIFGAAKIGYKFYVTEEFNISPEFNLGVDFMTARNSLCLSMGPAVTFGYHLFDACDILAQFQGAFSFPRDEVRQFAYYRIGAFIGASYSF